MEPLGGRFRLPAPNAARAVKNLALEVRAVDDVGVDDPEMSDARRREVHRDRGSEAAGADDEHPGLLEPPLAVRTDTRKDEVPAVSSQLLGRERRRVSMLMHTRNIQG